MTKFLKIAVAFEKYLLAITLGLVLILLHADSFIAFEAHIVNVQAEIVQIDQPTITPGSGSYGLSLDIIIDDIDSDASHVFYTITPGLDPNIAPEPGCADPLGGPKPMGPIMLTMDSVVKAVACDGDTAQDHKSIVTTEVYDLDENDSEQLLILESEILDVEPEEKELVEADQIEINEEIEESHETVLEEE